MVCSSGEICRLWPFELQKPFTGLGEYWLELHAFVRREQSLECERLFYSFERIGSLASLFRSNNLLFCSLCTCLYVSLFLSSQTASFSDMFSSGCIFLRQHKQNCACFGAFHHLWSFITILTGPAPSNASPFPCVVPYNVSCCPQCCLNAGWLSCGTWISCADVVGLWKELSWSHSVWRKL